MMQPGQFAHDFYQDLGLDLAGFEAEIDQELDKISVVTEQQYRLWSEFESESL